MGYYSLLKKSTITLIALFTIALSVNAQTYNDRWGQNRDDDRWGRDRNDDRYGRDYRSNWSRERTRAFAQMYGYRLAYAEVQESYRYSYGRGSYSRDYRNQSGYRDDLQGWFNWMGNRDEYRDSFRRGYEAGFRDATNYRECRYTRRDIEQVLGARMKDVYPRFKYDNDDYYNRGDYNGDYNGGYNGGYNPGSRYSQSEIMRIAAQNAYNDAFKHGKEDAERNRQYNYQHGDRFRDADRGYRSEYGNKEFYKQAYREGYARAYDEGFRSVRRGGRW